MTEKKVRMLMIKDKYGNVKFVPMPKLKPMIFAIRTAFAARRVSLTR